MPRGWLGRHPGAVIQPAMTIPDQKLQGTLEGKASSTVEDYIAGYCTGFWFRPTERQCKLFPGVGGPCRLHTGGSPDPEDQPPDFSDPGTASEDEMFQSSIVKGYGAAGCAMRDGFLTQEQPDRRQAGRELFGAVGVHRIHAAFA